MRGPHVRLGVTPLCLYPINPYNSTMIIGFPAKFTFPIDSCSTLKIGPYLSVLHKEIYCSIKNNRKKMIGHCTCFRENDDLPLWRGPAAKKRPPFFNVRALITHG